jgi:hypothetical protein
VFVRVGLHLPSRVALSRSPYPDTESCKMPVSAIDTIDIREPVPCPFRVRSAPRCSRLSASRIPPDLLVAQTTERLESSVVSRRKACFGGSMQTSFALVIFDPKRRWRFYLQSSFTQSNLSRFLSQVSRCAARRNPSEMLFVPHTKRILPSRGHSAFVKRTPLRQPETRSPERCFFPGDEPKLATAQGGRLMWINRNTLRASKRVLVLPPKRRRLAPFRSPGFPQTFVCGLSS